MAILVVGAHCGAKYELYAPTALGLSAGLSATQIEKIIEHSIPKGLKVEESMAFEVAFALVREAGPLCTEWWQKAVEVFGVTGTLALSHFVAFYAYLCILLNAFDAKMPGGGI